MRRLLTVILMLTLSAIAACAAPPADTAQAATPTSQAETKPATPPQAPASTPVGTAPVSIDRNCRSDADCAVKSVGNCCGALPACVNANSPTDPEGVRRECARSGRMSVCGFKPIEGCQCVQGQCKDKIAEVEMVH